MPNSSPGPWPGPFHSPLPPLKAPLYSGGLGDESPNVPRTLFTLNPSTAHPAAVRHSYHEPIPQQLQRMKRPRAHDTHPLAKLYRTPVPLDGDPLSETRSSPPRSLMPKKRNSSRPGNSSQPRLQHQEMAHIGTLFENSGPYRTLPDPTGPYWTHRTLSDTFLTLFDTFDPEKPRRIPLPHRGPTAAPRVGAKARRLTGSEAAAAPHLPSPMPSSLRSTDNQ